MLQKYCVERPTMVWAYISVRFLLQYQALPTYILALVYNWFEEVYFRWL